MARLLPLAFSTALALASCAPSDYSIPIEGAHVSSVVEHAGLIELSFTFKNTTDRVLPRPDVKTSCTCTAWRFTPEEIAPGETALLTLENAQSSVGTDRGTARLGWVDGRSTVLTWEVTALRPSELMVWPELVNRTVLDDRRELPFVFVADVSGEDADTPVSPDHLALALTDPVLAEACVVAGGEVREIAPGVFQGTGVLAVPADLDLHDLGHIRFSLGDGTRMAAIQLF